VRFKEIRSGDLWVDYSSDKALAAWRACHRKALDAQINRARTSAKRLSSASGAAPVPSWRPGMEWAYRWKGPGGEGVYVWMVDRTAELDGTECYVVKTGDRELFFRKTDLALAGETFNGRLELLWTPPRPGFVWPLEVGRKWEENVLELNIKDGSRLQRTLAGRVEAEETISVAAATVRTFKIVIRVKETSALLFEAWYAPDLAQVVLLKEHLGFGLRERELFAYRFPKSGPAN
jgi:hypothetical protein